MVFYRFNIISVSHYQESTLEMNTVWAFFFNTVIPWASLIAQLVKDLPAMQETLVWFLGQEDPLEKG